MTPKGVMSVREASTYLSIDEATLTQLAAQRGIPCMEVNGSWMFSKKSIDKWRTQKQAPQK